MHYTILDISIDFWWATLFDLSFVKVINFPKRKVVDEKDNKFFSVAVLKNIWFAILHWRLVIG